MKKKTWFYKMILSNNNGSAIVIAMLTLVIITIIGISTMDNSVTEKTIATNDMLYKQSFATADGGTQIAMQFIEETLRCGGTLCNDTYKTSDTDTKSTLMLKTGDAVNKTTNISEAVIEIADSDFAMDGNNLAVTNTDGPDNTKRDITFVENAPMSYDDAVPHTNVAVIEKPLKGRIGFSILMAEGYSGSGKSAGGDIIKPYDIHSKNIYKDRNSCNHIVVEYNTDGKCDGACLCVYQ